MPKLRNKEILLLGMKHVELALLYDNFSNVVRKIEEENENPHITADGVTMKILVKINASLHPDESIEMNDEEKIEIISKAIQEDRVAYATYLVINEDASLEGEINWQKLN